MNCDDCGKPLHPMRAQCDFCGAASPFAQPNGLDLALERTRAAATGVLTQARGLRFALPVPSVHAPKSDLALPSSRVLAMLGGRGLVVLLAVVVAVSVSGGGPSQTEVDSAQASAAASGIRQAELQTALDAAQTRVKDLEAAQARTQAEADTHATAAETEAKGLREQVKKAEAAATTSKEATDRAERRAQALSECLTGTTVAMQFGRPNSWSAADRALQAVAGACSEARAPR